MEFRGCGGRVLDLSWQPCPRHLEPHCAKPPAPCPAPHWSHHHRCTKYRLSPRALYPGRPWSPGRVSWPPPPAPGPPSPSSRPQDANPERDSGPPLSLMTRTEVFLKIQSPSEGHRKSHLLGRHPPASTLPKNFYKQKSRRDPEPSGSDFWTSLGHPLALAPCPTTYRRSLTHWMVVRAVSIPSFGRVGSLFELEEGWMIMARNSMRL
jgi:hypothetical protein